ncbi:CENP-S associating centromere protein X-domain-containing protein [Xylariales sp. AK1849]|nr:CENP-S associating centromere protein X-domain-containing protein [Xylariales sp. AK1849]
MPRNQPKPRGRPPGSTNASKSRTTTSKAQASTSSRAGPSSRAEPVSEFEADPFGDSQPEQEDAMDVAPEEIDEDDEEPPKTIPPELLTRLLHEFFEKDGTRISKNANEAVAKYMDVFVREAIARAAVEKEGGFLEVDDLEKVAPQLLLDL